VESEKFEWESDRGGKVNKNKLFVRGYLSGSRLGESEMTGGRARGDQSRRKMDRCRGIESCRWCRLGGGEGVCDSRREADEWGSHAVNGGWMVKMICSLRASYESFFSLTSMGETAVWAHHLFCWLKGPSLSLIMPLSRVKRKGLPQSTWS
jgi:hypothetical protein